MKNVFLPLVAVFMHLTIAAQYEPDTYLRKGDTVPQILLVGTFHFGYPGLDGHKTAEAYKLDILSPKRQAELNELLAYLKRFKPTKIVLEAASNTGYLMQRKRAWKAGTDTLKRDERDQIGIRLADELGLDTLYGANARGLSSDMFNSSDSAAFNSFFEDIFADRDLKDTLLDNRYWDWYDENDKLAYELELLEYFKITNTEKWIKRGHGHYIISDGYSDYNNMDGWFLLNWYSRNLRIFKNIQSIDTDPSDRILVLFGGGHMGILLQQFEATPEYDLIMFNDLENWD